MLNLSTQRCRKCQEVKPLNDFACRKAASNGRQNTCRLCFNKVYYVPKKDEFVARNKAYREAHPEEVTLYAAQYHIANREEILAYHAKHKHDNPHFGRQAQHKRRVRKYSNGEVENIELNVLFARDKGVCGICEEPVDKEATGRFKATIDHIIPISRGGSHTWANVQLAHLTCNCQKFDKLPNELVCTFDGRIPS